jgi:hypothetical protein
MPSFPFRKPKPMPGVLASFEHIDSATDAIRALRSKGHRDLTVYSSHPNHELEDACGHRNSPVRLVTLIGGLTGCAAGFAMQIWMNLDWPLVVGGKPVVAEPAFVVIGFEMTILLGALSTLMAVAVFSVLFARKGTVPYDGRFSDDRIGVFVPASGSQTRAVEELLRSAGAVEVEHAPA